MKMTGYSHVSSRYVSLAVAGLTFRVVVFAPKTILTASPGGNAALICWFMSSRTTFQLLVRKLHLHVIEQSMCNLWYCLEISFNYDAVVLPRASDAPEEICVIVLGNVDGFAIGKHNTETT